MNRKHWLSHTAGTEYMTTGSRVAFCLSDNRCPIIIIIIIINKNVGLRGMGKRSRALLLLLMIMLMMMTAMTMTMTMTMTMERTMLLVGGQSFIITNLAIGAPKELLLLQLHDKLPSLRHYYLLSDSE